MHLVVDEGGTEDAIDHVTGVGDGRARGPLLVLLRPRGRGTGLEAPDDGLAEVLAGAVVEEVDRGQAGQVRGGGERLRPLIIALGPGAARTYTLYIARGFKGYPPGRT